MEEVKTNKIRVGTLFKLRQLIIGVGADGEFGTNTDKEAKAFRKPRGPEVDGEVGPQTGAAGPGETE